MARRNDRNSTVGCLTLVSVVVFAVIAVNTGTENLWWVLVAGVFVYVLFRKILEY